MSANLTRISRFGFVDAYLVSEDDGLTPSTLVPRSAKVVLRAAEELGAPIVRIALTTPTATTSARSTTRGGAARRRGPHLGRDARLLAKDIRSTPASRSASCAAATRGPGRGRHAPSPPATWSARSKSSPRRGTRRGTSPSSTVATERCCAGRVHDAGRRRDQRQGPPALPAGRAWPHGPRDRARERPRPARAGAGRGSPRDTGGSSRRPRPPWTPR